MLVLSRKLGQRIILTDKEGRIPPIVITVTSIEMNKVRIGLDADNSIHIAREELLGDNRDRSQKDPS